MTGAVAVPLPARPVFGLWFPFRRVAVVLSGGFSGCRRLTDRERRLGQVLGALLRCGQKVKPAVKESEAVSSEDACTGRPSMLYSLLKYPWFIMTPRPR